VPVSVRPASDESRLLRGHLKNLSRDGLLLLLGEPLLLGEQLDIQLHDTQHGDEFHLRATVRWTRADRPGRHSLGCQMDKPADWATLGEMFVRGLLDADGPAD